MKSIFKKIAFVLALAMVVTLLPAKAVSAASSDGPDMYKTLRLYLDSGNGITENGDLTGAFTNARYASVWGWRENGFESVTFESADPAVATVSSKGLVTAVKVGSTTVTATFTGSGVDTVVKECVVTVKRNAAKVGLSADSAKQVEAGLSVGEKLQLTAVRKDAEGNTEWNKTMRDYTTDSVRFKSSNEDVFKVTKTTGMITATGAGEATLTVWAVQSEGKDAQTGEYPVGASKEYKVVVNSFSAEATGVKEITVTGSFTKDSSFTVKKGTLNINATPTVAEDGKSAKLALDTKLTKGVYTVSCGELSAEVNVAEDEKVAQIIVLENGGQVTTSEDRKSIYVHYDVLNQYGESVRKSYSITWTSSFGGSHPLVNAEKGLLTFSAAEAINYGSQIIITGVYAKSGAVVNATVTAGQTNCVGKIEVLGVLKKDTTTLLKDLPADFINGDYVLVYSMLDRLGYPMEYKDGDPDDLSFVSMSQLLFTFGTKDSVILEGEEYGTVAIEPNLYYASQGGNATGQVISKMTGDITPISLVVLSDQILQSFNILSPDFIIAEGEDVSIPYEATDTNGKPVTNFRVFSEYLTLIGNGLYMVENNDGSADLRYSATGTGAAEDIDATVMLMSTVTRSGHSSSVMLSVKEAAHVNAIRGMHNGFGSAYVLEGGSIVVNADPAWADWNGNNYWLMYYDQHDRQIGEWTGASGYGIQNVYNTAASYRFKIGVTYNGDAFDLSGLDANNLFSGQLTLTAKNDVTSTTKNETIEFYLYDTFKGEKVSGSNKKISFVIVDISQCAEFTLGANTGKLKNNDDNTGFWVNATLRNGVSLPVPSGYIVYSYTTEDKNAGAEAVTVSGSAITIAPLTPAYTETVSGDAVNVFIDYSITNSDRSHPKKMIEVKVTAEILNFEGKTVAHDLSTKVSVGIDAKKVVTLYTGGDGGHVKWIDKNASTAYIKAEGGKITYDFLMEAVGGANNNYDQWTAKDGTTVTVTKLVASESGLHPESAQDGVQIVSSSRSDSGEMIANAEIGDTFIATYKLDDATMVVTFTVGSDITASFTGSNGKNLPWK
ncbi:MAG: Ig-like domain-containing protein [Lachnospiraceae bacterium]|nr:Ig-like domain-containing protein [Lachnospiraceae bacterium]